MDETTARSDVVPPEVAGPPADFGAVRPRLVRLAFRFLWNRDDAEDVAQEALLIAQQRGDRLRDSSKWWSWLSRILVNRCHEHGRRQQRAVRLDDSLRDRARRCEGGAADSTVSGMGTVKDAVRGALGQLARRQHEVIVLRHLHGMTYAEVGEVLGISPATARVHARAGREALRRLLVTQSPELLERAVRERESNRGLNEGTR